MVSVLWGSPEDRAELLSLLLRCHPQALACASNCGPVCFAAVEMLAGEMGRWGQEEMLPHVPRTSVYTYLNFYWKAANQPYDPLGQP